MRLRRERQGFTLIELLVVIAIIAILAAILFPIMARAKKKAGVVTCMNNMRQMTFALFQYSDDNQGKLPRICVLDASGNEQWGAGKDNDYAWAKNATYQDLRRYVKNQKIFHDPACKHTNDPVTGDWQPDVTYRFNPEMGHTTRIVNGSYVDVYGPRSLTECSRPKLFYIVADRHSTHHVIDKNDPQTQWHMPMAFADGHVRGDIKIYSSKDSQGQYKPYHWEFPNCHPALDMKVASEYNN